MPVITRPKRANTRLQARAKSKPKASTTSKLRKQYLVKKKLEALIQKYFPKDRHGQLLLSLFAVWFHDPKRAATIYDENYLRMSFGGYYHDIYTQSDWYRKITPAALEEEKDTEFTLYESLSNIDKAIAAYIQELSKISDVDSKPFLKMFEEWDILLHDGSSSLRHVHPLIRKYFENGCADIPRDFAWTGFFRKFRFVEILTSISELKYDFMLFRNLGSERREAWNKHSATFTFQMKFTPQQEAFVLPYKLLLGKTMIRQFPLQFIKLSLDSLITNLINDEMSDFESHQEFREEAKTRLERKHIKVPVTKWPENPHHLEETWERLVRTYPYRLNPKFEQYCKESLPTLPANSLPPNSPLGIYVRHLMDLFARTENPGVVARRQHKQEEEERWQDRYNAWQAGIDTREEEDKKQAEITTFLAMGKLTQAEQAREAQEYVRYQDKLEQAKKQKEGKEAKEREEKHARTGGTAAGKATKSFTSRSKSNQQVYEKPKQSIIPPVLLQKPMTLGELKQLLT